MLSNQLIQWYRTEARVLPWRSDPTPYKVWISEIMLQQTRVEAVIPYFNRFLGEIPTIFDLAHVEEEKLLKLWQGLGYYHRALRLKEAAVKIEETFDGKIPSEIKDLRLLPGIGSYTAGAIASIAYGKAEPAIDGNVVRIAARLSANREDVNKAKNRKQLESYIRNLLPSENAGDFNQALMDLGATICLPNGMPECSACPVREYCEAYKQDLIPEIPRKVQKKARKIEKRTVLVLCRQDKFALIKRGEKGLLPNLWEFPNYEGHLTKEQCSEILNHKGITANTLIPLPPAKHIFTHLEWDMIGFLVTVAVSPDSAGLIWATTEEIDRQYSIPTAFKSFTKMCRK